MSGELILHHSVMDNMQLITPDNFDYFQMSVFTWYQECSNEDDSPPNLFAIFEGSSLYSQMFFNLFIDAYAQRYCKEYGYPHPSSPEFLDADQQAISQLFMRNFDKLQGAMVADMKAVLDAVFLTYVWDSSEIGGKECYQQHNPVKAVW